MSGPEVGRFGSILAGWTIFTVIAPSGSKTRTLGRPSASARREGGRSSSHCIRDRGSGARARAATSGALAWRAGFKCAIQIPHPLKKPAPGGLVFSRGAPTLLEQEGVRAWARAEIARIGWRQHSPSAVPLRQGHDAAATCQIPSPEPRSRA